MILKTGRIINNEYMPYIVAELNSSHNGRVETAKEMVDAAKECGCDAVKFQSWSSKSLYCRDYYEKNVMAERMVNKFALKPEELLKLSQYCREIGIDFSSTPYSEEEVDFLVDECGAPFVKVASMDIDNLPFLRYIAKKEVAIVLSTGMADTQEIERAVRTIKESGNTNMCILHCVSLYPAEPEAINLRNMVMIKEMFPDYCVGYSDHTAGHEVACSAVGLGACIVEKHFTLDNRKVGWDNQMATEPEEMKKLVDGCKSVYKAIGSYERIVSDEEKKQRLAMRRSIVARRDLQAGARITENDITAKRPGDGIPVSNYEDVIGRTLAEDVAEDHLILETYLEAGKE